MATSLGQGRMSSGASAEDMVTIRWKTWSLGCDVHVKTACATV